MSYPNAVKGSNGQSDEVQPVASVGLFYVDKSVPALTAAQAAGTDPTVAENRNRCALVITPPADCILAISVGGQGVPLFGGVPNSLSGTDCPANALYVRNLPAGAAVTVWEG